MDRSKAVVEDPSRGVGSATMDIPSGCASFLGMVLVALVILVVAVLVLV
jgi:hypothetical protein